MLGNVNSALPVYGKVGIRNYSGPLSEASIGALQYHNRLAFQRFSDKVTSPSVDAVAANIVRVCKTLATVILNEFCGITSN